MREKTVSGLKIIKTDCTDPYRNLAAEEYLTMNAEEDVMTLFLWQNAGTVVIGRNQNPWRECDVESIKLDGARLAEGCPAVERSTMIWETSTSHSSQETDSSI